MFISLAPSSLGMALNYFLLVRATTYIRQPSPPASAMARGGNGFPLLPGPVLHSPLLVP